MAIDGALRGRLTPGTRLSARFKGADYNAEVVAGDDEKVRFRLEDGREFTSPSAAGSAVMGGIACNGWRFWSLTEGAAPTAKPAATRKGSARQGGSKTRSGSQPPRTRATR